MTTQRFEQLASAALPGFRDGYRDTYQEDDDDPISESMLLGCLALYVQSVYKHAPEGSERDQTLDNVATLLDVAALNGGHLKDAVTTGFFETFSSNEGSGADCSLRLGEEALKELENVRHAKFGAFDPFRA